MSVRMSDFKQEYEGKPRKDPRRQLQGSINKAQGAAFENYISAACKYYEIKKTAFIEKTPEPMKVLKRLQDKFLCCFLKPAQPDYKGTLSSGRAVCFEAKATYSDKIEQSRVTPEQERALDQHFSLDAICFVLVAIKMQSFYRVPWEDWKNMKELFGHKYMGENDLQPYKIKIWNGVIKFLE